MTSGRSLSARGAVVVVAVWAGLAAAAGIPAPAWPRAQTIADEPQYLLSALSLAEDRDLDIADELADERWRDFHAAGLPEQTRQLEDGRRVSPHDPLLPLLLAPGMALGGWVGAKATLALVAAAVAALTCWLAIARLRRPAVDRRRDHGDLRGVAAAGALRVARLSRAPGRAGGAGRAWRP